MSRVRTAACGPQDGVPPEVCRMAAQGRRPCRRNPPRGNPRTSRSPPLLLLRIDRCHLAFLHAMAISARDDSLLGLCQPASQTNLTFLRVHPLDRGLSARHSEGLLLKSRLLLEAFPAHDADHE